MLNDYLIRLGNATAITHIRTEEIAFLIQKIDLFFHNSIGAAYNSTIATGSFIQDTLLSRHYDPEATVSVLMLFNYCKTGPDLLLNSQLNLLNKFYNTCHKDEGSDFIICRTNDIIYKFVVGIIHPEKGNCTGVSIDGELKWTILREDFSLKDIDAINALNFSYIKPLVRIIKYWNSRNGYVFEEQDIESQIFGMIFINCRSFKDFFYSAVCQLKISYFSQRWRQMKLELLKNKVNEILYDDLKGDDNAVMNKITSLIPFILK